LLGEFNNNNNSNNNDNNNNNFQPRMHNYTSQGSFLWSFNTIG